MTIDNDSLQTINDNSDNNKNDSMSSVTKEGRDASKMITKDDEEEHISQGEGIINKWRERERERREETTHAGHNKPIEKGVKKER